MVFFYLNFELQKWIGLKEKSKEKDERSTHTRKLKMALSQYGRKCNIGHPKKIVKKEKDQLK